MLFCNHIITANENSFKELRVWKSRHSFHFFYKISLTVILRSVNLMSKHFISILFWNAIWNIKFIDLRLWWFFGMQVVIFFFIQYVETKFCLPSLLVFKFCLMSNFVFIHSREGQWQIVLRVGIEVMIVIRDIFAQLFFLKLPNVKFLLWVTIEVHTIGKVNARLG